MNTQQSEAGRADSYLDLSSDVIERLLQRDIRFFVVASKPMVELPASPQVRSRETFTLNHSRFAAFIASFTWVELGCVLKPAEIKAITRVLEGLAWEQQETELPLETARDHEPLLDAVLLLMDDPRTPSPYEKTATALKQDLDEIARREGLDTSHPGWPNNAAWLSKGLFWPRLKPFFEEAGLILTKLRTSHSRSIRIERNDGSDSSRPRSSSSRHSANSTPYADSNADDGSDGNQIDFSDIAIPEEVDEPIDDETRYRTVVTSTLERHCR